MDGVEVESETVVRSEWGGIEAIYMISSSFLALIQRVALHKTLPLSGPQSPHLPKGDLQPLWKTVWQFLKSLNKVSI